MWFEALHGDPHLALSILDEVDGAEAVVPSNGPRRLLMRAVALHRAGEVDRARTAAAEAQAAAEAMGVPDLHARMHRPMLEVLGAAAPTPTTTPGAGAGASLRLLGGFSYTVGGEDRTPQPGHPATLVKLLALGGPLTTDAAIDALWPDAEPALGRPRLRNVLNRLKDRSGPLVVRDGEAIRLQDGLTVDAEAFEAAAAAALAAVDDERVGRARNALALYTGPLLPGDMYDDWCAAPRARLQRRYVSLADLVADDAVARGDLDEAARLLDLGITAEPLDEARTVKLCDLLTTQGRTTSARVVATRCADLLAELGVEPGPELARHLAR
jgi:DNA-binding SARP family transcriptional activator